MAAPVQPPNGQTRQLFGTDGMRGTAGKHPLDPPTVFAFGRALGKWASTHALPGEPAQVLIGMDTRESGPWLAGYLAGGLAAEGVVSRFAGLITTPGVAWLTKSGPFVAGVMISASHNPYEDNGLKAFDHSGYKLPDNTELYLEQEIFSLLERGLNPVKAQVVEDPGLDRQYVDHLRSTFSHRLDGRTIVVDCANGASVHLAPPLFESLGARVIRTGCEPDGRNINANCGALHTDVLRERVLAERADLGFAFDGDADRCIVVAGSGLIVDGDAVLLICARHLKRSGRFGDTVVATVMSNLGFEKALKRDGIKLIRTPVGDKYVLEEMVRSNVSIGGEQSGHVIFRDFSTTGDGLLTALRVLEAVVVSGKTLEELIADLEVYPQRLVNLKVREKKPIGELPTVQAEIQAAENEFNGSGRVLVRYSGTEAKIRVMVEGADAALVNHWVDRIADAVRAELS